MSFKNENVLKYNINQQKWHQLYNIFWHHLHSIQSICKGILVIKNVNF